MNSTKFLDLLLLLALLLISNSLSAKLRTNTKGTLSEAQAKTLIATYQPVVYLHRDETYFPTSVENLKIDWTNVSFQNTDTYVALGNTGPSSFDSTAPIYTSVYEDTSAGTVRISYIFLFGFNGCGPEARIKASFVGISVDDWIALCPADKHWGDVEHIEVLLTKNSAGNYATFSQITYAFHQWSKIYTSDGSQNGKISDHVSFESSTHPVVWLAKGSHASYSTGGDQYYYDIFDVSKSKKVVVVTVKVYSASLYFVDFTDSDKTKAHRWYGTAKLLKLNGNSVSGISSDEYKLGFTYYGRLGVQWTDSSVSGLDSVLSKIKSAANTLGFTAIKNGCASGIAELDKYYQATGVTGVAAPSRTWW